MPTQNLHIFIFTTTCGEFCTILPHIFTYSQLNVSGVNSKPVYRISLCLGRNDEIRKEYLSTGY